MRTKNNVEVILSLCKNMDSSWKEELIEYNMYSDFDPIYNLGYPEKITNTIIAFIVKAYDQDSNSIDVRRDRYLDKVRILEGLCLTKNDEIFNKIIGDEETEIKSVCYNYLLRQRDIRFRTVLRYNEFYEDNMKFIFEKEDENLADDKIATIKAKKMDLVATNSSLRKEIVALIADIKRDYAMIDKITETEFGYIFSDPENYDIMSWGDFLKKRNKSKS